MSGKYLDFYKMLNLSYDIFIASTNKLLTFNAILNQDQIWLEAFDVLNISYDVIRNTY